MRTQVVIIGAGPAGLVLGHLLHRAGIECVVLERHSRAHVEQRIRAGVLEHGTVELLTDLGVADRLHREGLVHTGVELLFDGVAHRIPLRELTGRAITVYGQHEVVKDLIARAGFPIRFEQGALRLRSDRAVETAEGVVEGDFVAGCDGFHGVSRPFVAGSLRVYERDYPFAWLGVLAATPPSAEELIYALSDEGFALHSMRSPTITRLYLQVAPDEKLDDWPDERIWAALQRRLAHDGFTLTEGPILEKGITAMRSFVVAPMRRGRLFLAGDAAHIVPPTGAKGLNLAVHDVKVLADGLRRFYAGGDEAGLDAYSDTCLRRVWRVQHFSWWMTSMLHLAPDADPFTRELQRSQLRYVVGSAAAATTLAENYVGLTGSP
ncbi:4-hydroxybenzoate 3-monooxygenase [Dactylosporangium sucinum]|uniref:4-hydroxybenzoate 3-monooxygenase n=1 Tax=Dactylosporangium sucinum TaxID=1424081 RepID=A0A917T8B7_9ACTN|nr:4-hydroxybenzoate 3-monooxygenase [Dactylosporangium sucinum]GGM12881.1 4-hydroxybenzoate 3-monooxygenase [Dactylosporangium sucinum]